jgi:very-short-patch-repair endonuclease
LTTTALLRHFGDRAHASHQSALVMERLHLLEVDLTRVHLTRVGDRQSRRQPAFTLHPCLAVPFTGAQRLAVAIVQAGAANRPISALVAADAALARRLVTGLDVRIACTLMARHPGTATTRAALAHADGRHESPGETRLAQVLRHLRIAATPQVTLERGGVRYRVDFLLDDAPVILEFDGKVKYESRDDLFAEKRREDTLRTWGYEVVRITWADLAHPERILRLVGAARKRSRSRSV